MIFGLYSALQDHGRACRHRLCWGERSRAVWYRVLHTANGAYGTYGTHKSHKSYRSHLSQVLRHAPPVRKLL